LKNNDWQIDAVKLANSGVMSWREIAEYLKVPKSTVSDYLRVYFDAIEMEPPREVVEYVAPKYDNSRILFISDMHIPYHKEGMLQFLDTLKTKYDPTRIVCLGDELDKQAMSFHDSDPDLPSAGDELQRSLPVIAELEKMFPVMDLVDSNHGSMVYRKSKHHGIPRRYIRSYNEVLGVGDGWVWHNDLVLDMSEWSKPDVYVHHGKTSDAIKTSQLYGMNHICGHYHESFSVKYWSTPNGLYWGVNAGCLIDDDALAFAYNNANLKRPIIGTAVVIGGVPILEVMPL
jgi:hypothetical protein